MTESMLPEDRRLVAVSQGARYIGVCAPAVLEEIKRLERELADAIRSLSDDPSKWIPVAERLPEGGDAVMCLAYSPTDSDGDASLHGALLATYDPEHGWASRTDTGCWEPGEITHWMPLPEAPK